MQRGGARIHAAVFRQRVRVRACAAAAERARTSAQAGGKRGECALGSGGKVARSAPRGSARARCGSRRYGARRETRWRSAGDIYASMLCMAVNVKERRCARARHHYGGYDAIDIIAMVCAFIKRRAVCGR